MTERGWPCVRIRERPWQPRNTDLLSPRRRTRLPATYRESVVPEISGVTLSLPTDLFAEIEAATLEIVRFDAARHTSLLPFTALLLRSEASASSRIERLTVSSRKLVEEEMFGADQPGSRGNAPEIVANIRAMELASGTVDPLSPGTILEMHRILMERTNPEIAGQFRGEPVWIGGSDLSPAGAEFVAPDSAAVPDLIDDLCAFMRRTDLPVLAKIAVAHAQFETIHPFADGNGRTGRALVHVLLRNADLTATAALPLSARLLTRVADYFFALTAYRAGDPEPVIRLFTTCARQAAELGVDTAVELRSMRDMEWEPLLTSRADAADRKICDLLTSQPVVDVTTVTDNLGCTGITARRALSSLEEAGIVVAYQIGKRRRAWRAPAVLELMDDVAEGIGRRLAD
ncbi:Fic family protein [Corynebacterium sp. CCM 9185]|uniref:Fic family protein n=1 Tax=Corynebacterium marambiense TaxID=2765364 RepID=A0ABS0W1F3_9CORY|nr:Fic family protein [Corynebacterium marambiense]MCK7662165.1 Fic family protein [Corynebacterium marambiense]